MSDMSNFSGLKVLAIILIVIVVLAVMYYATIDGIVNTVKEFFKNLVNKVIDGAEVLWDKIKGFLGKSTVKNGLYIYPIDKANVTALKDQLEANGIATDDSGLTEVILRKILLAQAVTTETQDTLCIAEIDENEILQGTGYTSLSKYFKSCTKKKSKNVWPIDDYNYDLYFITDYFFYFKDSKDMMGNGSDKYYLGIMGKVNIQTETGEDFRYVSNDEFKKLKEQYEEKQSKDRKNALLHSYTIDQDGQMKVYKIIENSNEYKYNFSNPNIRDIEKTIDDDNSTFSIVEVPLYINNEVDSNLYAVQIELLLNFLDMTGSPQYIDEFIDYAIDKTKITINGYSIENEEQSYSKDTYSIDDQLVYEVFDMVDGTNDNGADNMKTYKSLIYDRIYKGSYFSGSVVDLPDFEDIDYGMDNIIHIINFICSMFNIQPYEIKAKLAEEGYETEQQVRDFIDSINVFGIFSQDSIDDFITYLFEGESALVGKISKYLKTAYEKSGGVDLSETLVQEITINRRYETSWEFYITNISTWYGNIVYDPPTKTKEYSIDGADCSKNEYDKFDYNSLTEYESVSGEYKKNIFIYNARAQEAGIAAGNNVKIMDSADIFSDILNKDLGEKKKEKYENWTLRGLGLISISDGGKYNSKTGGGSGSDYLYIEYTKTDARKYNKVTKCAIDRVDMKTTIPKVDVSNIYYFLALWKNETGEIGNTTYKSDGKKVEYNDIYKGKIAVGDIFESAPEMLFELLESSDSTKGLVDVFKYIMYIYTGIDYGITDESQIAFIFNVTSYGGSDYIVNTTKSSSELVLTKEQLKEAINKTYKGNVNKNLLSSLDAFISIQENNKVNAVFAVAVTIIESSGGTNWAAIDSSTYNWYSIKGSYNGNSLNGWRAYSSFSEATQDFGNLIANGSYYFKAGKYTVTEIAPTYCNEAWGTSVIAEMTKIYNSIGISGATGGTEGKSGSYTTFTANGRTYINYKQIIDRYASIPLACFPGSTLKSAGCAITSDAIVSSGFGCNKDPEGVNRLGRCDHAGIVSTLTGLSWTDHRSFSRTAVESQLKAGNPVIVRYQGDGGFASSRTHFVAVLSISEDGSKMYVSNPSSYQSSKTGWLKTSYLNASGYCQYICLSR